MRTLISNLRVGANWRSVIPGLARAFVLHEKVFFIPPHALAESFIGNPCEMSETPRGLATYLRTLWFLFAPL